MIFIVPNFSAFSYVALLNFALVLLDKFKDTLSCMSDKTKDKIKHIIPRQNGMM